MAEAREMPAWKMIKVKRNREVIQEAREKLETSVALAMPCKIMKNCGSGGSDKIKTKLACILEAGESTRMRMGNSIPHNHEDHIAGKGETSLQHYNLVHKFIPMPQAMTNPAAKADKEWEKLEKISAWNLTRVKSKKQVIDEARTSGATVHFATLMDICHLKNAELERKFVKYKGGVVLRGDDSGSHAIFIEQGSSASQMTAAKVMDVMSNIEDPVVLQDQNFVWLLFCWDHCGKDDSKKFYWDQDRKKYRIGSVCSCIE